MDNFKRIQAIDRAVMILKCFSEKRRELKLSDIADELGLNKSTVHGIISTLKYHGLIDQNEENQKYRLGLYILELGDIVSSSMDIREIASPVIRDLCSKADETVHLGALDNMDVVYIDKQESNQSMRIFTTIGTRNPAYCTGIGKAMLAYVDKEILIEQLPDRLEKFTDNTITDKSELLKELEAIRENGYAMDKEERIEGLTCVAASVFDQKGNAKYAISVSGPTIRMSKEKIEETIKLVKEATKEISYRLGYSE
ncbi:MAG: IclR family transcriptional regulator [Pseudomonadota bacterium]